MAICLVLTNLLLAEGLVAGTVRYIYDELGRLIGVIDEQGQLTEYDYDPVGNILAIRRGGSLTPPKPTNQTLANIHRGEVRDYQVAGTGFIGATLTSPTALVSVSNFHLTSTQLNFSLVASLTAPLGLLQLTLTNAAGSSTLQLQVLPAIEVTVQPAPLAVPPDKVAYQARVVQSEAAGADTVINIVSSKPEIAVPGAAKVTLASGQSSVPFSIVGKVVGKTQFTLTSAVWPAPIQVDVFVDPNPGGFNRRYSAPLGIVKGSPISPNGAVPSSPVGAVLGIVRGSPISPNGPVSSAPATAVVGVVKGSPLSPNGPVLSAPVTSVLGVVRGSPISPNGAAPSNPVIAPPVGVFSGSPLLPNQPTAVTPVTTKPVGINK